MLCLSVCLLIWFLWCDFWGRWGRCLRQGSSCHPSWSWTHYVVQADLKLTEILLPQPPKYKYERPCPAQHIFIRYNYSCGSGAYMGGPEDNLQRLLLSSHHADSTCQISKQASYPLSHWATLQHPPLIYIPFKTQFLLYKYSIIFNKEMGMCVKFQWIMNQFHL